MKNFRYWFPLVVPVGLAVTHFIIINLGITLNEVVVTKGIATFAFSILTIDIWGITFIGALPNSNSSNMMMGWFLALVVNFLAYALINFFAQQFAGDMRAVTPSDFSKVWIPIGIAIGSFCLTWYFRNVQWKMIESKIGDSN
ncbi:MAG: hypothetical protein GYB31_20120 [Bacteroidetes bacterium]|nr:hypothetical protein [Bacteroidota bacterium]